MHFDECILSISNFLMFLEYSLVFSASEVVFVVYSLQETLDLCGNLQSKCLIFVIGSAE